MENYPRDFKGIWIPKEVWLDQRLDFLEKCLFSELHSLDGKNHCFASNNYLCKLFLVNLRTLQRAFRKLKELNLIEYLETDGRHRIIKTNMKSIYDNFVTPDMTAETTYDKFDTPDVPNLSPLSPRESIDKENKDENKDNTPLIRPLLKEEPPKEAMVDIGRFVKLTQKELDALNLQFGSPIVEDVCNRINDYLASSAKKPYADYAATIRNWIRRQQDENKPFKPAPPSRDKIEEFLKDAEQFLSHFVYKGEVIIGYNYIEFVRGQSYNKIIIGDKGWFEQIENILRKMEQPLGWLDIWRFKQ
jgi:hypothetical protein